MSDIEILNTLADVGEIIGVKRPVELFVNPLISSPMLLTFTLAVGATAMGAYAVTPLVNNNGNADVNVKNAAPASTVTSVSAMADITADNAKDISITAKSCGIELVKSESNQFTFDFLGVENPSQFKVNANSKGGTLKITVDGTAARNASGHYYIDDGANPVNVVRMGIPDREYQTLTMTLNEAPTTLPDFKAKINIQSEDGSVSIYDKDISKGSYNINNTSGGVFIIADTVLSNVSIENQGECQLTFHQMPQNLSLDLSACGGQTVLPDGWRKTQLFGNGTPSIKINNHGYTEVKVMGSAAKYKADSSGKIEIPVALSSLSSEICLGAIPDIRNAKSIRYDVHGQSGGSLFVGISPESSNGTKHFWVGSVESATRNIVWKSGKPVGYSKEHMGDYYVYIRSKYGDCSNIVGSIVIEYNK